METEKTVQQDKVIAAVLADSNLADVLSKLLESIQYDPALLARVSTGGLKKALATLPIDPNCKVINAEQIEYLYEKLREFSNCENPTAQDLIEAKAIVDRFRKIKEGDLIVPQSFKNETRLFGDFLAHIGFTQHCNSIVKRLSHRIELQNRKD